MWIMNKWAAKLQIPMLSIGAAVCVIAGAAWGPGPVSHATCQAGAEKEPRQVLLAIYKEVREFGYRDTENFIKREFHFDLDGSMANREEHVVVLSHASGNGEKMILQVTTFSDKTSVGYVRLPVSTLEISCMIEGDVLEIQNSMFDEDTCRRLFPEILLGIQEEKKLLKRLDQRR